MLTESETFRVEAGSTAAKGERGDHSNSFEGVLDMVRADRIDGWVWNPSAPHERVAVTVSVDGQNVGRAVADQYRGDLLAAGKGDGAYGFRFSLPRSLRLRNGARVDVTVADTPFSLGHSPRVYSHDLLPSIPFDYLINIGNVCNLRCPFCPTGAQMTNMSKGLMAMETFELVLERVHQYAYHFDLMNWGEPFLNPKLLKMIRRAADRGIRVNIDTNLTLHDFSEADAERIVQSGLWRLRASIDGASQATYVKYRRRGNFERAAGNLARVAQARRALGSATPALEWQFLINSFNEHEIELAKERAKVMGVGIAFLPMETWGQQEWRSSFHEKNDAGQFDRSAWRFAETEVMESRFFHSKDWSSVNQAQPDFPPEVPGYCSQPFNRMTINWDARVLPCCMSYGDNFYVGDLHTHTVEEIWHAEALRLSRRFLLNYGEKQDTGSVCETGSCALPSKYIGEPASEMALRARRTEGVVPVSSLFAGRARKRTRSIFRREP
jgi:MoaA/NifB/PqqE/SkfB family radical SAM enzyme